jgi:hypothetical protein
MCWAGPPTSWARARSIRSSYGSFDWHSCVHGHWLLASLYRQFPHIESLGIRDLLDSQFTAEQGREELAYLARPDSRGSSVPMAGPGC